MTVITRMWAKRVLFKSVLEILSKHARTTQIDISFANISLISRIFFIDGCNAERKEVKK